MYILDLCSLRGLTACYVHICPWLIAIDDAALTAISRVIIMNMTPRQWEDIPTVYLLSQSIYLTLCTEPTDEDKRLAEDYITDLESIVYQQLGNRYISLERGVLHGHVEGRLIILQHQPA